MTERPFIRSGTLWAVIGIACSVFAKEALLPVWAQHLATDMALILAGVAALRARKAGVGEARRAQRSANHALGVAEIADNTAGEALKTAERNR